MPEDRCAPTTPSGTVRAGAPLPLYFALFFLLICINSLVAKFVVFTFQLAPGVSSFYIVVACMIIFTLWFGLWGAGAAYIGCFIGAGLLSDIPAGVAIYWSFADLWEVLIPFMVFRVMHADPGISTRRDLFILIISGCILNNIVGAVWGSATLALGGEIPWDALIPTMGGWMVVNWIVCLILVPSVLYLITPFVREHELFVTRYWS